VNQKIESFEEDLCKDCNYLQFIWCRLYEEDLFPKYANDSDDIVDFYKCAKCKKSIIQNTITK